MASRLRVGSVLVGALVVVIVAGCATTNGAPKTMRQSHVAVGAPFAMVDTLAERWAQLEIRRAQTRVVQQRWAPESLQLDEQIAAVQEQLIATNSDARGPRRAMLHVVDVLDAQQLVLASKHRDLLVTYVATSDAVAAIVAEERIVQQRRAEMRASLLSATAAGTQR